MHMLEDLSMSIIITPGHQLRTAWMHGNDKHRFGRTITREGGSIGGNMLGKTPDLPTAVQASGETLRTCSRATRNTLRSSLLRSFSLAGCRVRRNRWHGFARMLARFGQQLSIFSARVLQLLTRFGRFRRPASGNDPKRAPGRVFRVNLKHARRVCPETGAAERIVRVDLSIAPRPSPPRECVAAEVYRQLTELPFAMLEVHRRQPELPECPHIYSHQEPW